VIRFSTADPRRRPRGALRLFLSAQARTAPFRMTLLPCTSTVIRCASVCALRNSACSIFALSSEGVKCGFTVIGFVTPLTPVRRRATRSASCLWYRHSTSPVSVTQPLETVTSSLSADRKASHSRARMAAAAMSASVRSAEPGSRTSIVVRYGLHTAHAVRGILARPAFGVGVDPAGERDDPIVGGHADLVGLDAGVPLQLRQPRWHYDILRALDYFQAVDAPRDRRLAEAIDIVHGSECEDGRWLLQHSYKGKTYFELERLGAPSRWNTLRALRVLKWWEGGGSVTE
jgi:hypothetical protein